MIQSPAKFYITTAIDYPNSDPHMGHAYEKVVADFYARAYRFRGADTWFLIGLDEHGQKIQRAAADAGRSPQEFVDEKAEVFRRLYGLLEISCDDFIRTSEERHHAFVRDIYSRMRAAGDIYKGVYRGDYCVACERAYTKSELAGGLCPVHGVEPIAEELESYFFRLGKYREPILRHIRENPDFVRPPERRNEIVARLEEEVLDLSVSRNTFDWGIPVPDDPSHVIYVWIDALSNYASGVWEPRERYERYWPADCHVIGKDIIWFHAVIWPAMLLSAGHPLPKQVYAHGFVLDEKGRKMAKQLGNVVAPLSVVEEWTVDVLRFYFLRAFSSGADGNFSLKELEERYESELANDLGNLVLRVAKLVRSRLGGAISTPGHPSDLDPSAALESYCAHVDAREHHRAVESLWSYVRRTNAYLNEKEPWKLRDEGAVAEIVGCGLEALRTIAHLLEPVMPATARSIAETLGFSLRKLPELYAGPATYRVALGKPLFPRREKPELGPPAGKPEGAPAAKPAGAAGAESAFAKLELRVGLVEEVRDHPSADSLFAMTVDLGGEKRSICAGLRGQVAAGELRGRKVVVVANLKPARLRGIESRGMILATDSRYGRVVPVDPGDAPVGELVRLEGVEPAPKAKLSVSEFEKVPLAMSGGVVACEGKALRTSAGPVRCDAPDGARVR